MVLLNHGEFSLTDSKKSLVDLLYYILKANRTRAVSAQVDQLLSLDSELLPSGLQSKRLIKRAKFTLFLKNVQEMLENETEDM